MFPFPSSHPKGFAELIIASVPFPWPNKLSRKHSNVLLINHYKHSWCECISSKSLNLAELACISESLFVLLVQLLHPFLILLQCTCKENASFKRKREHLWKTQLLFYPGMTLTFAG